MKYYIKTFGCQQNVADSERVGATYRTRGISETDNPEEANFVIVNTCMVREKAEHRVYGFIQNMLPIKQKKQENGETFKIIVTGCMVGIAFRDKSGEYLQRIRTLMPEVDEFMPIEEVGFDLEPVRQNKVNAWVPISNGCNNFCTFCVVPFTRGREISRPFEKIIAECTSLKEKGFKTVTLLGQNVNSYGADLLIGENNQEIRDLNITYFEPKVDVGDKKVTYVKHLGRQRIPTLFPHLLEEVAKMGFEKVDFFSSNPWDFSDDLIDVIAKHKNISRLIHLPVQSGDDAVLKRMNRWYTAEEYAQIIEKLRAKVPDIRFTTDIIVGFCGETDDEFQSTVELAKRVSFEKAYLAMYSQRPMTAATKVMADDVPHEVKKQRWQILEDLINKPWLERQHKTV